MSIPGNELRALAADPNGDGIEFIHRMQAVSKLLDPGEAGEIYAIRRDVRKARAKELDKQIRRNRCDFALGAVVTPRDRDISKDDYTPTELMNFRPGESAIYFIAAPLAKAIKIGVALDINKRLPDIAVQSPVPIVFLGACAGDAEFERRLHRHFASIRVHGEWFRDELELRDTIEALIVEYPHRTMAMAIRLSELAALRAA